MISFFKKLFGSKNTSNSGCCGKGCCGHANKVSFTDLLEAEHHPTAKELDAKIVVGKIREIFAHPDEKVTKVQVTRTEIAPGQVVQILCGAPNIQVGQVVPVATIGTDFGEGFVISQRNIRGEDSHGMICSRSELSLGEGIGEGIWELPEKLEIHVGKSLKDLF